MLDSRLSSIHTRHTRTSRFVLLGKSDCANRSAIARAQIQQWEAQNLIAYAGESSDVRPFIESCSCVVLPSFYKEGVPRVLLEAMSMGKPIITTDISGCKECIKPPFITRGEILIGQNGILIPPRDPLALTHAMQTILSLPQDTLRQMGVAGRAYVLERFSITRIISHYQKTAHTLSHDPRHTSSHSTPQNPKLAFISNTSYAMLCFRANVLQALQQEGYAIHIIAPLDSHSPTLREFGFHTHHIDVDSKGLNPLNDFKTARQIHKILSDLLPAVVFDYTIKPVIYGSFVANRLHIPNIAIITGLGYVFMNQGLARKALRHIVCMMYKIALKHTKQVWFLNTDDMQEFLDSALISREQAFLLDSEGVDTEFFKPVANPTQNLAKAQSMEFLLIARMLWDKGVGEFVQAAKMIRDSINKGGGYRLNFIFIHLTHASLPKYITPRLHSHTQPLFLDLKDSIILHSRTQNIISHTHISHFPISNSTTRISA